MKECDVFSFATKTWSSMRCPASPRISAQLVPLDGKLYLVGGSTPGNGPEVAPAAALEVYDPKTHRSDDTLQVTLIVPPAGKE